MSITRSFVVAGLVALAGCGLGIHVNPTAATVAPYHDHQNTIEDFPRVRAQPRTTTVPGVGVGTFARYYAEPIGFTMGIGAGARRSWGRGKTLTWLPIVPAVPPEQAVQAEFTRQVGGGSPDAELLVSGVITDLSWYELKRTKGGRITTRVVVTRRDGTPVFEGERSTVGRAEALGELIAVHVDGWLADPKLVAAMRAGGTR